MVRRSKGLSGRVRFDDRLAIAYRLRVDDAIQPILDSMLKSDRLHLEVMPHRNVDLPSHTLTDKPHFLASSEGRVPTQAKTAHSRAALESAAHALQAV